MAMKKRINPTNANEPTTPLTEENAKFSPKELGYTERMRVKTVDITPSRIKQAPIPPIILLD